MSDYPEILIRNVEPMKDLLHIVHIITKYFSSFTHYIPKTELDIKTLLNSSDFFQEASYVAISNNKIIGFVGALIRVVDSETEGEIIGPAVIVDPLGKYYFHVMKLLLENALKTLKKYGITKISTIATPQFSHHFRFLEEHGFRPIKAWYLMKVSKEEVTYPGNLAKDLKIIPYARLKKDGYVKMDLILSILNAAFFDDLGGGGWDENELMAKIRDPVFDPNGIMVGYYNNVPVGVIWVFVDEHLSTIKGKKIGWVALLGLKREYRGRRYGRTLLKAGLDYLFKNGVEEVLLWVDSENSTALRLYRMFNFSIERSSYLMWYFPKR